MTESVDLKIVQIVVEVGEGDYCAVKLPEKYKDLLMGYIAALSDGPVQLIRLTGVKMVPVSELEG
jgi:hypothetical protein